MKLISFSNAPEVFEDVPLPLREVELYDFNQRNVLINRILVNRGTNPYSSRGEGTLGHLLASLSDWLVDRNVDQGKKWDILDKILAMDEIPSEIENVRGF